MLFICYEKCSTCKKALKWLDERGIKYEKRDIKSERPTREELDSWLKISGLPVKRFWNTSGIQYREMNLKDRLPEIVEGQQLDLLASDGMLVKRPILIGEGIVLVGFKEQEWQAGLKIE